MQLRVYYLDDEQTLCENFADDFGSKKVIITTFTDSQEAIQTIKVSPPDLLFLDYRMPGTTGDRVAEMIDPKIPKYLITGDLLVKTSYQFKKVFSKPYKCDAILEVLDLYLSGRSH